MSNRIAKLIMVTAENSNKFYHMKEENGVINVEYGRIDSSSRTTTYPLSKWDSLYNSKVKKGYVDQTEFFTIKEEKTTDAKKSNFVDLLKSRTQKVVDIVTKLQGWAKGSIEQNYTVSSKDVTQAQVDEAQRLIDSMSLFDLTLSNVKEFNDILLQYFMVVPRRMKRVQDNLLSGDTLSDLIEQKTNLLNEEQNTLDVMAGQVKLDTDINADVEDDETEQEELETDIIKSSGLEIEHVTDQSIIDLVKSKMQDNAHKLIDVFEVINKNTQLPYDSNLDKADDKKTELFWHGSRNENWWSILTTGLKIRPSNAIHTGSMFGDGVYFADKFQKSFGYTSGRGSYWTSGSNDTAILALYNVHVGKQKHITHHNSSCYNLSHSVLQNEDKFDSVFAHGGADLRNNEYIVYTEKQTTVKYLVIVKA